MLARTSATSKPKGEAIPSVQKIRSRAKVAALTFRECEDALRDLFLAAQEEVTFPGITLNRLAVIRDENTGLLL